MEDADLEEIRAKRLAQLQSEYKVNYEFTWSSYFYWNLLYELTQNIPFLLLLYASEENFKICGKITSCISVSQSVSAFLSVLFYHAVSCPYCWALMIDEWLGKGQWWNINRGKPKYSGDKPAPVPLCPPQIPYGLASDLEPVLLGENRRPTVWVMAWPSVLLFCCFILAYKNACKLWVINLICPFLSVVNTWLHFIMFVNKLMNLHSPFHIDDNVSKLVFVQWCFFKQVILAHMGIRTLNWMSEENKEPYEG